MTARKYMHTPGVWYPVGAWIEHGRDDVADIATFNPADIGQDHLGRSPEEIDANAMLCSGAPYMVDQLEQIAREADELAQRARRVIASVTTPYKRTRKS